MPVVPLYPLPWRSPWDLPSSRLCRGDVPRSSTPMGSRGPWPSAPLMWPSVLLTTSAPTINRSSRGSIPSRLRIAARALPVYASPPALPLTTQHSVPGAWPGLLGSGPTPDWQSRALLGALGMAKFWRLRHDPAVPSAESCPADLLPPLAVATQKHRDVCAQTSHWLSSHLVRIARLSRSQSSRMYSHAGEAHEVPFQPLKDLGEIYEC